MTGTKKEEVIYNKGMDITPEQNTPKELTTEEQQKTDQVRRIIQSDQQAFEEWVRYPEHNNRLDLPYAALRYLMIPERVLELADDPSAVNLIVLKQGSTGVKAFVVEHKSDPITDPRKLEEYWEYAERSYAEQSAEQDATGEIFAVIPQPPEDVDKFLADNRELIESGQLGLNDLVTNDISLGVWENNEILGVSYWDRETSRNLHIGSSFYNRLHEAAKELGFRFIVGANNPINVGFFTTKLGRVPLSEIKPEFKKIFNSKPEETTQETITIDFLRPEDKAVYVVQPAKSSAI